MYYEYMTTQYYNHILEPVTSAKYLGVTLQSNLKWNTHIDNITSNGNKSLGYLKRNLQISNPEVKSRAYQALVMFHRTIVCGKNDHLYVSFCVVICLNVCLCDFLVLLSVGISMMFGIAIKACYFKQHDQSGFKTANTLELHYNLTLNGTPTSTISLQMEINLSDT
jgi:hypothetical protein